MMDRTNAQRQRRYIARLKARAASAQKLEGRIRELEAELARERKRRDVKARSR